MKSYKIIIIIIIIIIIFKCENSLEKGYVLGLSTFQEKKKKM
jgi:hypothetical protein